MVDFLLFVCCCCFFFKDGSEPILETLFLLLDRAALRESSLFHRALLVQCVNAFPGRCWRLVEDFSGAAFCVACVAAQSVSVSSFQLWRRVLFKTMAPWLGLDHLRVCCGQFSSLLQLQLRIHTPSTFSASSSNSDFSACSVWRERRGT